MEDRDPDLVNLDWTRPADWPYLEDWGSPAWKRRMVAKWAEVEELTKKYGFQICPSCQVEHSGFTITCRGCGYCSRPKKNPILVRNPNFDPQIQARINNVISKIELQAQGGQTKYPHLLDVYPLRLDLLEDHQRWLARRDITKDFSLLELAIYGDDFFPRTKNLTWICSIEAEPIGYGRLVFNEDRHIWQTYAAYIAYQGLGIYPRVLQVLRQLLGPFESKTSLSPGAHKAWQRAGGTYHKPEPLQGYYTINPDEDILRCRC